MISLKQSGFLNASTDGSTFLNSSCGSVIQSAQVKPPLKPERRIAERHSLLWPIPILQKNNTPMPGTSPKKLFFTKSSKTTGCLFKIRCCVIRATRFRTSSLKSLKNIYVAEFWPTASCGPSVSLATLST